jgi:lipoprotein-anchoring transpeptidase ErfK/SrfK
MEGQTMMRRLILAAAAVAATATCAAAQTIPRHGDMTASTSGSQLGGGFIEMLMTGRSPGVRAQPEALPPLPAYAQPRPMPAPRGAVAGYPVQNRGTMELSMEPSSRSPDARPQRTPSQHAALNPEMRQVERTLDPRFLPQVVDYNGPHRTGTVVIDTNTKYLYLVEGDGKARRYGIGVGRPGFEWAGTKSITRKAEWPDWRPPAEMLKRRPDLPQYMAGGPENPMGARGLYLGSSLYRIHGTNEPHTIGQAVSSGCIRMRNEDVTDLYDRVRVGTKVIVM